VACNSVCRDIALDPSNCGACGKTCGAGEVCSAGACVVDCGAGTTKCEVAGKTLCIDTQLDPSNCGARGKACGQGELCSMGACGLTCNGGSTKCGDACTSLAYDPKNCGGCGNACVVGPNALGFCVDGKCGSTCTPGFGDCNSNVADGCESSLSTPVHCGACGKACAPANGQGSCLGQTCVISSCNAGFGDCDGKVDTGCETNTNTTDLHCGKCGTKCAVNEKCEGLVCKPKGLVIKVEGHADVIADCPKGDHSCQAKAVCEAVTGLMCVFQQYDCAFGNQGSWYPLDGQSGSSNFDFADAYDLSGGTYGNICACNQGQMTKYGLAANHTYCGLGLWQRQ
jgi:hypothetical protein